MECKTTYKKHENENERDMYFGCVEPDQIERVEIEGRVRTVKNGPCSELSGSEARDYNAGELGVVKLNTGRGGSGDGKNGKEEKERTE